MAAKLAYSDAGKGFPLVLLHGFCESKALWDDFIAPLSKEYRVLVPDLPGFGDSKLPEGDFTIDEVAEYVMDWLKAIGVDKAVFVGHSLGGYVALSIAKYYPECVTGLGLFHSSAFQDDENRKDSRNKTIDFVERKGVKVFAESFISQLFYVKNRSVNQHFIDRTIAMASATKQNTLIQYTKAMRDRHDSLDVLRQAQYPVLIIAGDQDTAVPLDKSKEMAEMTPKAMFSVLTNVGHMGMYEKQSETIQLVSDYMAFVLK